MTVHVGEVRDPNPADQVRYDELYTRVAGVILKPTSPP